MWDHLKSRRGLASGAAVLAAAIIGALLWASPKWRSAADAPFQATTAPAGSTKIAALTAPPTQGAPPALGVASTQDAPSTQDIPSTQVDLSRQASSQPQSAQTPTAVASAATSPSSADALAPRPTAAPAPAPGGTASSGQTAPSFDVVRVTPDGESVVAARAAPNVEIALMDGDTVIARSKTDASGQVAFIPPTLKPGEHSLALAVGGGSAAAVSSQSVAVSVPDKPKTAAMVAVIQPDQGAKILSGPVAGGPDAATPSTQAKPALSGAATTEPPAEVAIQSVEVEDQGSFFAGGKAAPDSQCRVYLNGSFVATVTADGKGLWSLQIKRGMRPGHYAVRVDQIEKQSGKVTARAEVPFDYPVGVAGATMPAAPKAHKAPAAPQPETVAAATPPASQPAAAPAPPAPAPVATSPAPAAKVAETQQPAPVPSSPAQRADPAKLDADHPAVPTIIDELLTARVSRGDTLWRISRKMLGHGVRYTQIYAANTQQIRNPRLIYPGQIFVMPKTQVQ